MGWEHSTAYGRIGSAAVNMESKVRWWLAEVNVVKLWIHSIRKKVNNSVGPRVVVKKYRLYCKWPAGWIR